VAGTNNGSRDHMSDVHYRYLLVIAPPVNVAAHVQALRDTLQLSLGRFQSMRVPPHITLLFVDMPETLQDDLVKVVAATASTLRPITLGIQGITHFPDKRTIYFDVLDHPAVATVREPIASAVRGVPSIERFGMHVTDHPHLTIATGLRPDRFEMAWPIVRDEAMEDHSTVHGVVLLRRALKPDALYTEFRRFQFGA
jgi:2'-5' RNA ligase